MSAAAAITLRGVTKDFVIGLRGVRLRAVDSLSLEIQSGEIFGLLGPNGCGKSTSIKLVLGFIAPTAGNVEIRGIPSHRPEARASVGYLPESPDFYRFLSGRELVAFYGRLSGLAGAHLKSSVQVALESVDMEFAADRKVGTYSKGMLQRIGLAQAMVHDPEILILDEPTAGVDPVAAASISKLLLKLKSRGKTIVITSHLLTQMDELCDRVAILHQGRLLAHGRPTELVADGDNGALRVGPMNPGEREELDRWLISRGHSATTFNGVRPRLDHLFAAHFSVAANEKKSG
jgi:ABC-2 type transport system ATP-binding protein